jgi:hypothetical protein
MPARPGKLCRGTILARFATRQSFPAGAGMHIVTDTFAPVPPGTSARPARRLVPVVNGTAMTLEPEKAEDESGPKASPIPVTRQLTAEEEQRVLYLKNLLAQLLTMSEGQPTDEQKTRIRDIEKELEKITGVKVQSSLGNAAETLPGKTAGARRRDEEEEERRKREQQVRGIDPKEMEHPFAQNLAGLAPVADQSARGLKMLKNAGSTAYQAMATAGLSPAEEIRSGVSLRA